MILWYKAKAQRVFQPNIHIKKTSKFNFYAVLLPKRQLMFTVYKTTAWIRKKIIGKTRGVRLGVQTIPIKVLHTQIPTNKILPKVNFIISLKRRRTTTMIDSRSKKNCWAPDIKFTLFHLQQRLEKQVKRELRWIIGLFKAPGPSCQKFKILTSIEGVNN